MAHVTVDWIPLGKVYYRWGSFQLYTFELSLIISILDPTIFKRNGYIFVVRKIIAKKGLFQWETSWNEI